MSQNYRYPGVTPFTRAQSNIFFGREEDTELLYKRILREDLVVLHGKSGLGKSSIINAGILPKIEAAGVYTPFLIRFGARTTVAPLQRSKTALQADHFLLTRLLPEDDSLWKHAKAQQLQNDSRPLLIFDQFEELFSYSDAEIQAFEEDLAGLLNTSIPLRFRRRLEADENLSDEEEEQLEAPLQARILFAIRLLYR